MPVIKNVIRPWALPAILCIVASCADARSEQVADIPGAALRLRFGQTVSETQRLRPSLTYKAYEGWVESGDQGSLFQRTRYDFGEPPLEEAGTKGRLRSVQLTVADVRLNDSIVGMLDRRYGAHAFVGCVPMPPRRTPEEVAVISWPRAPHPLFVRILAAKAEGGVEYVGPANVFATQEAAYAQGLGADSIGKQCFSATRLGRVHPRD